MIEQTLTTEVAQFDYSLQADTTRLADGANIHRMNNLWCAYVGAWQLVREDPGDASKQSLFQKAALEMQKYLIQVRLSKSSLREVTRLR